MGLARAVALSMILAACSRKHSEVANVDEPWSHANGGAANGWWKDWDASLNGKPPFGVGTRFETETIGPDGAKTSQVLDVQSITPAPQGAFEVVLQSSGGSIRASMPPRLRYNRGPVGLVTTRNEKLVWVSVPAGKFAAGRLWSSELYGSHGGGSHRYERDEWVVPDLPIPVQSWSRPIDAKALYNPPDGDSIPRGTMLTRLIRITRK